MHLVMTASEFLLHVYESFFILKTSIVATFVGHLVSQRIEQFACFCFTCIFDIALLFIFQL